MHDFVDGANAGMLLLDLLQEAGILESGLKCLEVICSNASI